MSAAGTPATPPPANPPVNEPNNSNNANGGRNNNRNNANGRNGRRNQRGGGPGAAGSPTGPTSTFKGTIKEMNGHVYQCYGESTEKNQFTRTMEELDSYVGLHFKHDPGEIKTMLKTMKDVVFTMPKDYNEKTATKTTIKVWEIEVDAYVKGKNTYKNNKVALYSVIWAQCSEAMQTKVKSDSNFTAIHEGSDSLALVKVIKGIAYKFETQKNTYLSLDDAKTAFYTRRQGAEESPSDYMTKFQDSVQVIEHYGGTIGIDKALITEELQRDGAAVNPLKPDATELAAATLAAKKKIYAIAYLKRADKIRYGLLLTELENNYTRGTDQYPVNLNDAHYLLVNYKKPFVARTDRFNANPRAPTTTQDQELSFAQQRGADPPPIETVQCYNCQNLGHYANNCTLPRVPRNNTGTTLFQANMQIPTSNTNPAPPPNDDDGDDGYDFSFHLNSSVTLTQAHMIDPNWILLDSESTVSIFSNRKFLRNIRPCGSQGGLRIHSNGGFQDTYQVGDLPGFGTVWYNEGSLANILSMAAVRRICRITMDTQVEAAIYVHKANGQVIKFLESSNGLYYHDVRTFNQNEPSPPPHPSSHALAFMNTVAQNQSLYTRRQLLGADLAKRLYELVGRPSMATFIKMIQEHQLGNCPITVEDAQRAAIIYGPDIAALRGKTVRKGIDHVPTDKTESLPMEIRQAHDKVTLCVDFFFVDGHAFLGTVSRDIRFVTAQYVQDRKIIKGALPGIQRVNDAYKARGLNITNIHADDEFASLQQSLLANNIVLNVAAQNEHVPEIERTIRTIKERNRATVHGLPFLRYPKLLKIALIIHAVLWINMFPHADGVSAILSPRTIVTGATADYQVHCRVPIGAYCETHDEPKISNTEMSRTTPAIALFPTGNAQGAYYFLSLVTGKRISRRNWTELPIPDDAIERVHELANNEQEPDEQAMEEFRFEWAPKIPIVDIIDDQEEQPPVLDANEQEDQPLGQPEGTSDEEDDGQSEAVSDDTNEDDDNQLEDAGAHESEAEGDDTEVHEAPSETSNDDDSAVDEGADHHDEDEPDNNMPVFANDDQPPPRYNLRGKKINYEHRFDRQFTQVTSILPRKPVSDPVSDLQNHILATGLIFNQMSAKKGIKLHGEKAITAIVQEFKQLDDKTAFKPREMMGLTEEQREQALRSITLIKEKRCGRIKGRTVADGRGQRDYISHDEATSPTVSLEALMISIAIDAKEDREVATADVEGAYLNADMDDEVIMVFEGNMVDYMVQANPERYAAFVHITSSGKKLLFVQVMKALYGCIKSAMLWYNMFASTLKGMGFVLNPYDPCVANKMINGKQCTICWYVDDLKVSHVQHAVVKQVISEVEKHYGQMVVTYGNKHTYVGMDIEYTGNGEAKITMISYLKEALDAFPEDCTANANTPAASHLFEVNQECPKISEPDRQNMHSIVAKLLFVGKRARPDIQVPIAFLTSRVTKADQDDWKKLKRMLQYIHSTIDMPLTISIDNMSIVKTWVDAAYATHDDMRSHTGGVIMMGKGTLYAKSSKQKINVKSSTEAELVGASDFLPQTIWTNNFVDAQGYEVDDSDFHQDNMSSMKMEKNGRASVGQRSRHINIRYFFIKDRIANGEINLVHCPTGVMIADFFTKPLQGQLFAKFRDIIMGITHFSSLVAPMPVNARSVLEKMESTDKSRPEKGVTSQPKKGVTFRDGVAVTSTSLPVTKPNTKKNKKIELAYKLN